MATGLAIAAIIFSGVGILVALGIGATALALAGRTLLAATGNGSWSEVALDAFSLVAFGSGKWAGTLLKGAFKVAEDTANGLIQAQRDARTPGTEVYRDFKDHWTGHGGLTTAQANDVVDVLPFIPVLGTAPAGFRAALGGGW